jgi:hypothetical protein
MLEEAALHIQWLACRVRLCAFVQSLELVLTANHTLLLLPLRNGHDLGFREWLGLELTANHTLLLLPLCIGYDLGFRLWEVGAAGCMI